MAPALLEISYTLVTIGLLSFFFYISLKKKWGAGGQMVWWILFGTIFNLYSLSWLYTVYPLMWMSTGILQIFAIALLHFIIAISSGICFFVVGCATSLQTKEYYKPFVIAFSFVIAEILRSLIISLIYSGDDTRLGLHFTAGTLGNALSTTPLIELAYLGGTFALTFFLTLIIASFFYNTKMRIFGLVSALTALMYVHYLPVRLPSKDLTLGVAVTAMSTSDGQKLWQDYLETNKKILSFIKNDQEKKDIIILPEDARFLSSLDTENKEDVVRLQNKTVIVDGNTIVTDGKLSNISLFFTTNDKKLKGRGKELLLPFNEYIPYFFDTLFQIFAGKTIEAYKKNHTYSPSYSHKTFLLADIRIGTIICSEILSFSLLNRLFRESPEIIFYQSRLNVFNNNPWFTMHLRSFSKVAAAQLRTTIISSNNYAPSYVINGRGDIVEEIPVSDSYTTLRVLTNGEVILKKNNH